MLTVLKLPRLYGQFIVSGLGVACVGQIENPFLRCQIVVLTDGPPQNRFHEDIIAHTGLWESQGESDANMEEVHTTNAMESGRRFPEWKLLPTWVKLQI